MAPFAGSAAIVAPPAFPVIQVEPPSPLRQTCPSSIAQVVITFAAREEIDPVPGSAAAIDHSCSAPLRRYTPGCADAYNVDPVADPFADPIVDPTSVIAPMFGGTGTKPSLVMVHVRPPSSLRADPPTLLCR